MLKANVVKTKWAHSVHIILLAVLTCASAYVLWTQNTSDTIEPNLFIGANVFSLEVADTEVQRVKGLSDRNSLDENNAMLFVFSGTDEQCMWMKDMSFALDIVWLNEDKQITRIGKNITPDTYPQAFCGDGEYVLEFVAGTAENNSLKIGQNLNF